MRSRTFIVALVAAVSLLAVEARAVDPTATATAVPPTATWTSTPTYTPNPSTQLKGKALTESRLGDLTGFAPGAQRGDFNELLKLSIRQIKRQGTNATALGLRDVGVVTSILAFTTSSGASATKELLVEPTDYTVTTTGDIVPVGDHSAQTWVITYRPYKR